MVSKKMRFLQVLCWLVFIGWAIVAFMLSKQDGASSEQVSVKATRCTVRLLDFLGLDSDFPGLYMVLRKIAHFLVHCVLAMLGGFAFATTIRDDFMRALRSAFYAACAIAVVNELVQLIAAERTFALMDIIINLSGVALGTLFSAIIILICEWFAPKPTSKPT